MTRENRREIWTRGLGHIDMTKRERAKKTKERPPTLREAAWRDENTSQYFNQQQY
jgi:hypothetical protein